MYSLKDIVRINDILSEYHGVKCVVVKIGKKELEYFTSKFPLKTEEDVRLVRNENGIWF